MVKSYKFLPASPASLKLPKNRAHFWKFLLPLFSPLSPRDSHEKVFMRFWKIYHKSNWSNLLGLGPQVWRYNLFYEKFTYSQFFLFYSKKGTIVVVSTNFNRKNRPNSIAKLTRLPPKQFYYFPNIAHSCYLYFSILPMFIKKNYASK